MNATGMHAMRRAIALVSFCVLAACSAGGSETHAPAPSATPPVTTSARATTAHFTITVPPARTTAAANVRTPKYISTATQSIIITLTSVNGAPYTGTPAAIATNLAPSNPACTSSAAGLTCTATATAIPGSDMYNVVAYDTAQTSASPMTPAGNVLSQSTVPLTIVAGQTNTLATPLVLNGVAASSTVTFPTDPHISGTQTAGYSIVGNRPFTFTVTSLDASGATIVGPGAPTYTVTGATPGVLAFTPVSGSANTFTVQAQKASATPVSVTITPSSGAATTVAITTTQELWLASEGNSNLTGFLPGTTTVLDNITSGINDPTAAAFDTHGNLWVANFAGGNVTAYAPGGTQIMADTIGGLAHPTGLAFDAQGNLWVSQEGNNDNPTVEAFAPGTTTAMPTDTIPTSAGLSEPIGLAFDASGTLWVANAINVLAFTPGTSTPIAADTITTSEGPTGVAFDTQGNLWIANEVVIVNGAGTGSVMEFKPGTTTPSATLTTGIEDPFRLAFDASGNLWVVNFGTNTVAAFAPGGTAPIAADTISALNLPSTVVFAP
jgi:sugar lactone lactonase YvrE